MAQEHHMEINASQLREQHLVTEVQAELAARPLPNHNDQQWAARFRYAEEQAAQYSAAKLFNVEEDAMQQQLAEAAKFSTLRNISEQRERLLKEEIFAKTEGLQISHDQMTQQVAFNYQELAQ